MNGTTIDEHSLMPLGLFLAGIAIAASLAWKTATMKADTKAKLRELERRLDELERDEPKD